MLEALSNHDREQKGVTQHEPNETGSASGASNHV